MENLENLTGKENQQRLRSRLLDIMVTHGLIKWRLVTEIGINYFTINKFTRGEDVSMKTIVKIKKYIEKMEL